MDPTYTLAPTVGWTAIEMSAGITSACLPTLLPVLNKVTSWFGIKTPLSAQGMSKGQRSIDQFDLSRQDHLSSKIADSTTKSKGNNFYRLPDENESDHVAATPTTPLELQMYPEAKEYSYTVKSQSKDRDEESGDDLPLHGIRVKTSFEHMSLRK